LHYWQGLGSFSAFQSHFIPENMALQKVQSEPNWQRLIILEQSAWYVHDIPSSWVS
jgi:hypothetical protein